MRAVFCAIAFAAAGPALLGSAAAHPPITSGPAAPPGKEEADRDVETIIVTGLRIPTAIEDVGAAVSVITAADIERRQQRFLADALLAAPGVQLIRSGGPGALASVSIRGLPSAQTLVVLDGVVINNPASFGSAFNFATFDTADVERVEILRGAQSTLYGSDAIGGVVNIVTHDGAAGPAAAGYVEGGSFGTARGAASFSAGGDSASARIGVSASRFDGISAAAAANGNPETDGLRSVGVTAKVAARPAPDLRLEGVLRYQDARTEFDGFSPVTFLPEDADNVSDTEELSVAGFAYLTAFEGRLENRASLAFSRTGSLSRESGAPSFDARGDRRSVEYQGTIDVSETVRVIIGAEWEAQSSRVALGFGGDADIKTVSGFGLVQLEPFAGATLAAGVRHDATSGLDGVAKTRDTTLSGSGAVDLPAIGLTLRGAYAEGFRAPSAGEITLNPGLQSEVGRSLDIGLSRDAFAGAVRLEATYFRQRIDDLIAFDPVTFTPVNLQRFESRGVEIAARARLSRAFEVSIAYALVDAENASTTNAAGLQPRHRVNVELAFRPTSRLDLSVGILFNGEEELFGATVEQFALVNLRASYRLDQRTEIFARIENATDTDYEDNPGYGTAPLSAFSGLRFRL